MSALGPMWEAVFAVVVFTFIVATAVLSVRAFRQREPDLSAVHGSAMLGPTIRAWYFENLQPIEDFCVRYGISATAVTCTQWLLSLGIAYAYAEGWIFVAGWLVLTIASFDIIDGRIARRTHTDGPRGAFLDSVLDRYADAFAYMGLAVYFRDSGVLWLVLLALVGASMVSYTRARAEALGVDCRVGLMQRPERTVLLGFGSMFSVLLDRVVGPWFGGGPDGLLILVLAALAVLTNGSAAERIVHVQRRLGE